MYVIDTSSVVDNLIKLFPDTDNIPSKVFSQVWKETGIVNLLNLDMIILELKIKKRNDLIRLIYSSQEHFSITLKYPNVSDIIDKINREYKKVKNIDIGLQVSSSILLKPKVRNIIFNIDDTILDDHTLEICKDRIIDIFVTHIKKWKGEVSIRLHSRVNILNEDFILEYNHGYISFNKCFFSIDHLSRLKPEGYELLHPIYDQFNQQCLYYALLIPSIKRIKFNHIPKNITLVQNILIPSCDVSQFNIDITKSNKEIMDKLYLEYHRRSANNIPDTKNSKIEHIIFEPDIPNIKLCSLT